MTCRCRGRGGRRRTFDVYEKGRRIIVDASAEDLVRALWARWHARQGTFAGEAFEIPDRLRFEVGGLTIVERKRPASGEEVKS